MPLRSMLEKLTINRGTMQRKVVVGLGNPGAKYSNTWHNLGFLVLDEVAQKWGVELCRQRWHSLTGEKRVGDLQITLLKPLTMMNSSGLAVRSVLDFYKLQPEDVIVIYDDIDLNLGDVRIRKQGGAGTHNGMRSIVKHLQSQNFVRVRVGFGPQDRNRDIIDLVLSEIKGDKVLEAEQGITKAADAVRLMVEQDIDSAMRQINVRKQVTEAKETSAKQTEE